MEGGGAEVEAVKVATFFLSLIAYSIGVYTIGLNHGRREALRALDDYLKHVEEALSEYMEGES